MSNLNNNTTELQAILDMVNALPEAGTQLPELTTPATASDILSGKEAIDENGEVLEGTFTIDSELTTQDNLISQIQTALQGKAGGTSEPTLQEKTVTPSTSSQTVTPDANYDGLSKVTVNAMPTATQATPSISVSSAGLITASATQTAGYVSAGTKSATKQLTTQAAKTVTPSTSSQTAVASGVYTTGAVTVAAIPSTYVKPTTTKSATTYTPTTSNQTIAAGTYCSGIQTIKGDSNLKAENIAEGVSIFGVAGTHSGGGSSSGVDVGTIGASPMVYSTSEGSVIYCTVDVDGSSRTLSVTQQSLTYFSTVNKYRVSLAENVALNTPIVVLTSGHTTFPTVTGCVVEDIATGIDYTVYQITASDSDSGGDDSGPTLPG